MKFGGSVIIILLSFQLSAQIPNWVLDSLIFEAKLSRQCTRLDSANQIQINALESLLVAQGTKISLQKEQITTYEQKVALFPQQLETQRGIMTVEKTLLKTKIKGLKRWLALALAGDVGFIVLLVLLI